MPEILGIDLSSKVACLFAKTTSAHVRDRFASAITNSPLTWREFSKITVAQIGFVADSIENFNVSKKTNDLLARDSKSSPLAAAVQRRHSLWQVFQIGYEF